MLLHECLRKELFFFYIYWWDLAGEMVCEFEVDEF